MSDTDMTTLLVDAHVHIYDCFDVDQLLDAALRNFKYIANKIAAEDDFIGLLLLSETSRDDWFQNATEIKGKNYWKIKKTKEKTVLQAILQTEPDSKTIIYIVAGRQIITGEGLEVLALVTDGEFEDGLSMATTLSAIREQEAIPVVPWAVGKWLGKKGKILSALLRKEVGSDLCLGDNSRRPTFWYNPSHFKQANELAMHILPGTDPLPFASEVMRVGSFGFSLRGQLRLPQLAADLKQLLRKKEATISAYGRLETSWRFVVNQIRLRSK